MLKRSSGSTTWVTARIALTLSALCVAVAALTVSFACHTPNARAATAHKPPSTDLRPWNDYHVIMWVAGQPENFPLFLQRLTEIGVNTGMISGAYDRQHYYDEGAPSHYAANGFPYYVENIVNKGLNLEWRLPKTAPKKIADDWLGYVDDWIDAGRPQGEFKRPYSLDDPAWQTYARRRMRRIAELNRANNPLAYDIRDEISITRYANPFDWDYSPATLSSFRAWLQAQYADLDALNAEWQTQYRRWGNVMPFSTDRIKHRMTSGKALPHGSPSWLRLRFMRFNPASARRQPTAWNFAPWADFRTYMDVSLARALDNLRHVAHEVDPHTPVGIEGTQMPSAWGGYDLSRLSDVLDWVEPYDIGNARAIWASFMDDKPVLSTVFTSDPDKLRRSLWHNLFMGDRGAIIWWSKTTIDLHKPGYPLTRRARAIAPVLKAMQSPLARLFMRASRVYDPIALVYSQPSLQATWLIESMADGGTWPRRASSYDARHSHAVKVRDAWLKALQDLGYTPRFINASALADKRVRAKYKAIVLPTTLALSTAEIEGLQQFIDHTGAGHQHTLLADGEPGAFDQHARLRSANPLAQWFGGTSANKATAVRGPEPTVTTLSQDIADYRQQRLQARPDTHWAEWIADQLPEGMAPAVTAGSPVDKIRVHRFRLGKAWLIAMERNYSQSPIHDLDQSALQKSLTTTVTLSEALPHWYLYNLRTQQCLGSVRQWQMTLDPTRPSLYALWPDKVADGQIVSVLQKALSAPGSASP